MMASDTQEPPDSQRANEARLLHFICYIMMLNIVYTMVVQAQETKSTVQYQYYSRALAVHVFGNTVYTTYSTMATIGPYFFYLDLVPSR